jgi:hypothetical protein
MSNGEFTATSFADRWALDDVEPRSEPAKECWFDSVTDGAGPFADTLIVARSSTSMVGPAGVEPVTATVVVLAGCRRSRELIGRLPPLGACAAVVAVVGTAAGDPPPQPLRAIVPSTAESASPANAEKDAFTSTLLYERADA